MSGPSPFFRPEFPAEFLDECRRVVRLRSVSRGEFQRARLVLLLHRDAAVSNVAAERPSSCIRIRFGCGDDAGRTVIFR